MFRQEEAGLRSNGETIGGIKDGLSSAQDRLSKVNGSCSFASSHKRMRKLTVNKTKSSLVQVGSQGVRVD
jgi:hypothetical protein